MIWQIQDAKSKLSQVINLANEKGPQIVTRHGKKVAIILSFDEHKDVIQAKPSLLSLLLEASSDGEGIEIDRDRADFGRATLEL